VPLLLAGCTLLAPRPESFHFVVLTHVTTTEASPPRNGGLALGLGPIGLPGYLEPRALATRVAENRIEYSDGVRWAEPLEENFARVLGRDLALLLGLDAVVAYPWPRSARIDYSVGVEVFRFDTDTKGGCELTARFSVRDRNGRLVRGDEVTLTEQAASGEGDARAAALSRTVEDLARTIAAAIPPSEEGRSEREASP
jgi:uncharacterized lipoprotein YmbA